MIFSLFKMATQIILKLLDEIYPSSDLKSMSNLTLRREYQQQRKQAIRNYRERQIVYYLQQDDVQFMADDYGKPYVVGHKLAFNHSHSADLSALFMSDELQDIGIDIEQLQRKVRFEAMAQHCFHDDEYQIWQQQGKTANHWFKIWTVKEAVLKASGLGIRMNLNELNTQIQQDTQQGMIYHEKIGYFQFYCMPCCILSPQAKIDFMLAVAWRTDKTMISHQHISSLPKWVVRYAESISI